jgi:hypothetical protein
MMSSERISYNLIYQRHDCYDRVIKRGRGHAFKSVQIQTRRGTAHNAQQSNGNKFGQKY